MTDDNMDELFRRAANDYPLKTDSGEWEKMNAAMQTENALPDSNSGKAKKKTYRKFLWLLLLLPMAWICNGRFFMNASKQSEDNVSIKQTEQSKKSQETISAKNENKNSDINSKKLNSTSDKNSSVTKSVSSATNSNLKKEQPVQLADATTVNRSETKINSTSKTIAVINKSNNNSTDKTTGFVRLNKPKNRKNKPASFSNKKDEFSNSIVDADNTKDNTINTDTRDNTTKESESIPEKNELNNNIANKNNVVDKINNAQSSLDITKAVKSEKIDSAQKQIAQIAQQKTNNPSTKNKIHSLYAGVVTGFDVSTVEFQSVKNTGYSAGILVGYQLNKKLSIESGLLWDKKYYYTDGKYFDPKKINVPYTAYILNANGNCNMFELPVNIKYNWTSTSKSNWFSTLGLSTYFMKKENYEYTYEYTGWSQQGNTTYNNATTNWFGVINFSAGYMHTLGKAGSLRVEPYLKIPVQGLGIGSLSIWSTGIYVSFVKTIFTK